MSEDAERALDNLFLRDNLIYGSESRLEGGALVSRGGDIVNCMLTIRNQVKLYHWQTGLFSRHKATDDLVVKLDANIDMFVEAFMGKYGRPKIRGKIELHNFSEKAAKEFIASCREYLSDVLPRKLSKSDTDLLNIRDTILGDLNQVLYLFTLN